MSLYGQGYDPINFLTQEETITSAQTLVTTNAKGVPVFRAKMAYVQFKFKGVAGSAGPVSFKFVARGHEKQKYPTIPSIIVSANADGENEVIADAIINCESYYDIKLKEVVNASGGDIAEVQASISYKH